MTFYSNLFTKRCYSEREGTFKKQGSYFVLVGINLYIDPGALTSVCYTHSHVATQYPSSSSNPCPKE